MEDWSKKVNIKFQQLLDKSAPFKLYRWLALGALVGLYAVRVFSIKGFFIITYALGIYNLNLLLGFISPSTDPELDGPVLPSRSDDEYRPFVRRLQEMKFWYEFGNFCASEAWRAMLAGFRFHLYSGCSVHVHSATRCDTIRLTQAPRKLQDDVLKGIPHRPDCNTVPFP